MQDIQGCQGHYTTVCALKLAPLVFVRPSELRGAKWEDIDLEAKEWRYFVSKTKTEHIVPLSSQAMTLLAPQRMTNPPEARKFKTLAAAYSYLRNFLDYERGITILIAP